MYICVYVYVCVNSTDYPPVQSTLPEVSSVLARVSAGACQMYLFQVPLSVFVCVCPRNISKKKLQKRIFGSPLPRMHPSPCLSNDLHSRARWNKKTEFSFSRKPITIRIEENNKGIEFK